MKIRRLVFSGIFLIGCSFADGKIEQEPRYLQILQKLQHKLAEIQKKRPLFLEEKAATEKGPPPQVVLKPIKQGELKLEKVSIQPAKAKQATLRATFKVAPQELFNNLSGKIPTGLTELVQNAVRQSAAAVFHNLQRKADHLQVVSERGILDTRFSFTARRSITDTPNDAQEALTRQFQPEYESSSGEYEMGFKGQFRSGAEWAVRVIYDKLNSSIIEQYRNYTYEYTDNVDLSLRMPMQRGKGENATLIKVHLAKSNEEISLSKYRQELMDVIGLAIQNYWRLYGALELEKSWQESLKLARKQYQDARLKVESGRAAETDLLTIESAIALRRIELAGVQSRITQLQVQLLNLLSLEARENHRAWFSPTDIPKWQGIDIPRLNPSFDQAKDNWPEFKIANEKLRMEKIKARHAVNETLPQLDLVGNVRNTNLTSNAQEAFGDYLNGEHASWYVGLEYSIPMKNTMADSNLKIANLRVQQAQLELESLNRSLKNGLFDRIEQLKSLTEQLEQYEVALAKEKELLKVAEEKVNFGRAGIQIVFEQQEKLIEFQRRMLNTVVEIKLVEAALQKAMGTLLSRFAINTEELDPIVKLPEPTIQAILAP